MSPKDTTDLADLTAQARAYAPLPVDQVAALLEQVRAGSGNDPVRRLAEHHLSAVLDAAVGRRDHGVEVGDLYQEGSIAAMVAVEEYARRGGAPAGLGTFVMKLVAAHLDDMLDAEKIERETEAAFVRDAERYEAVELGLRSDLARGPTPMELAAVLGWPLERIALIGRMLDEARAIHDGDIVAYLDDDGDSP